MSLLSRAIFRPASLLRASYTGAALARSLAIYRGRAVTRVVRPAAARGEPACAAQKLHQVFKGIHMAHSVAAPSRSVTIQNREVKPLYADACGNTFLIYDLTKMNLTSAEWESTRQKIWDVVAHKIVDDALVLRRTSASKECLEVKMHVLEPDRTEADFCGNGARATGTYLAQAYGKEFSNFALSSRRGLHPVLNREKVSFINMGKPAVDGDLMKFKHNDKEYTFTFVDAVEPHLITKDFFDQKLLTEVGDAINKEWRVRFPHGVNVNCLRVVENNAIDALTYERGLYHITKACGTGSTACIAAAKHHSWLGEHQTYRVNVLGGVLQLLSDTNKDLWLGGSVILKTL